MVKSLPAIQEKWVRSLRWEKSPREGNGNPVQYSCLENSMDRGAWRAPWGCRARHNWPTNTFTQYFLRSAEQSKGPWQLLKVAKSFLMLSPARASLWTHTKHLSPLTRCFLFWTSQALLCFSMDPEFQALTVLPGVRNPSLGLPSPSSLSSHSTASNLPEGAVGLSTFI